MWSSSKCRGCGAEIRWIKTEANKAMPVDANPRNFYVERIDSADGISRQTWKMMSGYESHFATCPKADQFRKKKGDN